MKYDPILCINVPDSKSTKDAEYKMFGPEFHHPIIKANSKEEAIKKAKEIYGWGGKVEAMKVSDEKALDKAIKNCDEEYKMKVTSYVINKGQSGEYYGLKNKETNQVLYSAPNNWKSREGAKRWAEKKGMIYED